MGSLTVAPIGNYTITSELSAPDNYANLSNQQQLSVSLTDSSLWLVDISQLRANTSSTDDLSTGIATQPIDLSNQLTVPFNNISNEAAPITLTNAFSSTPDQWSALTLPQDSTLQMAAFSGNVQLASSDSSGGTSRSTAAGSTSTFGSSSSSFASSDTGSAGVGTASLGSGGATSGGATSGGATSGTVATDATGSNGGTTSPTAVPFEFSQTLGLLLVFAFFGTRKLFKGRSNLRVTAP